MMILLWNLDQGIPFLALESAISRGERWLRWRLVFGKGDLGLGGLIIAGVTPLHSREMGARLHTQHADTQKFTHG